MGRLADARKRAHRTAGGTDGEAPAGPKDGAPASAPATDTRGAASRPDETDSGKGRDEEPAASPGRIRLPSSGLAADILAREETSRVALPPAGFVSEPDAAREELATAQHARSASFSFFAAPARDERVEAEATEHLATFWMGREEYGVDVRFVQEIRRMSEITQVPRAPAFIEGVINLRGRIIPVVDLKKKLAIGAVEPSKESRIVVVRIGDRLLGLLVDGASQVLKVAVSKIEPPPTEVMEKGDETIRGVAKLDTRLIILLDLPRILAQELGPGSSSAKE